MKEKGKKSRNSSPILLGIGMLVVVLLLLFSYMFYQRLMGEASNALGEEAVKYSRHYVLICDTKDSDVWNEIYEGMQKKAFSEDAYLEMMTPDETNQYSFSDLVDICIAAKVDGIVIQNHDEKGLDKKIDEASQAGIPVVTLMEDSPLTGRISHVGASPYTVAELYANEIIQSVRQKYSAGEEIKVAVILTVDDIDGEQYQQFSEINTRLTNELGDYKIKASAIRTNARENFYYEETIRDLYRGKDIPNYVVCFNSLVTDAVYQTVIDYNAVNTTNILGSYMSPTTKQGLENNIVIGTLLPESKQISEYAIQALTEYIESGHTNAYFGIDVSLLRKGDLQDDK